MLLHHKIAQSEGRRKERRGGCGLKVIKENCLKYTCGLSNILMV